MRFCPVCGRVMARDHSTGAVVFKCACGTEEKGDPTDARISGAVSGSVEQAEMYRRNIQSAAHDRVNQVVRRQCTACGLDYAVQIRVGKDEVIIYRCKCGREEVGGAAGAAPGK